MTVTVRKWITGSEGEPSNCLGWENEFVHEGGSKSGSLVANGETSTITDGFRETRHVPLHDASTPSMLQRLIFKDAHVNENARRLQEELSLQFQNQLMRRRERPLPATENEAPRLPIWATVFLGITVPFLIAMVARELIRIKSWELETWVSYEDFHRQYYEP